jgi:hypothetical protein
MKKLLLVFLLAFALAPAEAALSTVGSPKSLSAVDSALTITARGFNSVSYQLTGTWSATVKFEGTVNGTTWTTVFAVNQNGGAVDSVATANGVYLLSGNGFLYSRARVSARTSGTVVAQAIASEGSGVVSLLNQTSAGAASNVAVTSSVLPTLAATSTKQSDGTQKTQVVDGSGNVIGATSNALDVNIKSGASSGAVAQGSTTSGQTGSLTQAAVTTAAPSYTTGQTSPLSLTTGGALRVDPGTVTVASHAVTNAGTFATQSAQSGTWTVQPGNTANTTAWKVDGSAVTQPVSDAGGSLTVDGTVAVTGVATAANQSTEITSLATIAGAVKNEDAAHTSTDPGIMPLAVRRDANTTLADATGDYAPLQVDASGSLKVAITAGAGSGGTSIADDAAFTNASTSVTPVAGVYNSTLGTVADGAASALAITPKGSLMVNLRDASGTEVSVGGGTQYDDDAVYAGDGAKVTMAGVVRRDANTTLAGADGDVAPLQVNAAGALKVDASGAAVPITDNSGSLTVDYATTGSGTATGALRVELPTNGTGVIATVGAVTAITNALPAGTNAIGKLAANNGVDIGDVDVASVAGTVTVGGTAAADAAASGNPVYVAGRASAAAPSDVSADGDVVPAWRLRNGAAASVLTAAGALIGGDATNGLDVDITRNAALVAGSAIIGKVGIDQTTPGTTNLVALAANQSVNVAQINGVTTLMGNGVTGTGSQRVTIASDNTAFSVNATAVGAAAHDAAISGAPVRLAGRALTSDYTAVATGDVADLVTTVDGKLIQKPFAIRPSTWTYAAASGGITNTTAATMKAAAAAGIRNCLTGIQVINGHATVSTEVLVRDGAAGTVLHRGWAQAAGGGFAANFDVPLCGTAATLMEVVPVTTGSAIYANAQGFISAD